MRYKKADHKRKSKVECLLDGLVDIESIEHYRKLVELKKATMGDIAFRDFKEILKWKVPESFQSDKSHYGHITYKVCDISRLPLINTAIIGRIVSCVKCVSFIFLNTLNRMIISN